MSGQSDSMHVTGRVLSWSLWDLEEYEDRLNAGSVEHLLNVRYKRDLELLRSGGIKRRISPRSRWYQTKVRRKVICMPVEICSSLAYSRLISFYNLSIFSERSLKAKTWFASNFFEARRSREKDGRRERESKEWEERERQKYAPVPHPLYAHNTIYPVLSFLSGQIIFIRLIGGILFPYRYFYIYRKPKSINVPGSTRVERKQTARK